MQQIWVTCTVSFIRSPVILLHCIFNSVSISAAAAPNNEWLSPVDLTYLYYGIFVILLYIDGHFYPPLHINGAGRLTQTLRYLTANYRNCGERRDEDEDDDTRRHYYGCGLFEHGGRGRVRPFRLSRCLWNRLCSTRQ